MKNYTLSLSLLMFSMLISCSNEGKKSEIESKISNPTKGYNINTQPGIISSPNTAQKVYELKDDGIYIYSDANPIIENTQNGGKTIIQKNFKYIYVPSSKNIVKDEDGPETKQLCSDSVLAKFDYGKPSLKELGYERHQEREILPEDNRFGVSKKLDKYTKIKVERIASRTAYSTILKSAFKELLNYSPFLIQLN